MTAIGVANYLMNMAAYFAANYILVTAFDSKKQHTKLKDAITLWLITVPLATLKLIFNSNDILKFGMLFVIIIVNILYLYIQMEGRLGQKILFVMLQEMAIFMGEGIVMVLFASELEKLVVWDINLPIILIIESIVAVTGLCLYTMVLYIWKRFVMKRAYNAKTFLVFLFFPLSQVFLICSHNIEFYDYLSAGNRSLALGILIGFMADILLLAALLRQQQMNEMMEEKLGEVKQTWEIEKKHYEEIENRREELAKIRHDMNEQFILMKELLKQDDREKVGEMLDTLTAYVASTREYVYCGDPVMNAIMAENEKLCGEKQIKLAYEFDIPIPLKMNPVAICSIFTNLFRNAIAAAEQAEGEKFISIKAALKGEYLHIKEENPYNPMAKKKDDHRGYGIEILKSLVKQHDGQMEVSAEDEVYRVEMSVENRDVEG